MSMEDPGWGDHVPLPGQEQKEPAAKGHPAGGPPTSPGPPQPPRAPWWRRPLVVILGAATVLAAVAVPVVMALSGDGSDPPLPSPSPSPSPDSPGELTQEEFIARANAVCTRSSAQMGSAFETWRTLGDPSQVIQTLESFKSDFVELGLPPQDVALVRNLLTDFDQVIAAARQNNPAAVDAGMGALTNDADQLGLTACSG